MLYKAIPILPCHLPKGTVSVMQTLHKHNPSSTYKSDCNNLFFFFLLTEVGFWLGPECLPCKRPLLFYLALSAQRQGSPLQKHLSSLSVLYFVSPVFFLFVSFPHKCLKAIFSLCSISLDLAAMHFLLSVQLPLSAQLMPQVPSGTHSLVFCREASACTYNNSVIKEKYIAIKIQNVNWTQKKGY